MNITYKVAIVNNYLVITSDDLPDFLGVQGLAKNVTILPTKEDSDRFDFWGLDNSNTKWDSLNLNQILDENGDPFTLETWTEFYTFNTGFNTAPGGRGVISQTITDGVTDRAPSENAVFDALAGKLNKTTDTFTGVLTLSGTVKQSYTDATVGIARPVINEEYFIINPVSAPASAIDFHGLDLKQTTSGLNINSFVGLYPLESQIFHTTSQTLGRGVGMYSLVENQSTGNLTEAVGLQLWNRNQSTGVIALSIGTLIYNPQNSGGGTITNHYSIYLHDVTTPTGDKYGLYSLADNYMHRALFGTSNKSARISNSTSAIIDVISNASGVSGAITATVTGSTGNNTAMKAEAVTANTFSNTALTLSAANAAGANIALRILSGDIRLPSGVNGFTGTGAYTNFTIEKGIITNAT